MKLLFSSFACFILLNTFLGNAYSADCRYRTSSSLKNPEIIPVAHSGTHGTDKKIICSYNECFGGFAEEMAAQGHELHSITSCNAVGYFDYLFMHNIQIKELRYLRQYPKKKLILFLWEPPSVMPENYNPAYHKYFDRVYTFNDELVDNVKYFKFYYPVMYPMVANPIDFDSKKLCALFAANKGSSHPNELYSERRQAINFYENYSPNDFDLYGEGWPNSLITYKGTVGNKTTYLQHYKFSIAYENIKNVPGYITEKIFDCFQAGCVPVYWGASNITTYIPKDCFIAREDFEDDLQLYIFMKSMTEMQHQKYVVNIQNYLDSETAKLYSVKNYLRLVKEIISDSSG